MAILFDDRLKIFKLDTRSSTYMIQVYKEGYLVHLYYGAPIPDIDAGNRVFRARLFSFSPTDSAADKWFSADISPMEYPCGGMGDYRVPSLVIRNASGDFVTDIRYVSHRIVSGKPPAEGLPSSYADEGEFVQTLEILCADRVTGAEVTLYYGVFEDAGVITRRVRVANASPKAMALEKVHSACVDLPDNDYDFIQLYGKHCGECNIERAPLHHGLQSVGSVRGMSGHFHNPFAAFAERGTGEENGSVYGIGLIYSGNFSIEAECDSYGCTRVTTGINESFFSWKLESGESFSSPEAVLVYTNRGIGEMSRIFHRFYADHLIRGKWKKAVRPLLLNSWEAMYFDFDGEKICALAKEAAALGIELFVLDDGWFGKRNDDTSSLGDWFVNTEKIKGGLKKLSDCIRALGMRFGLWFEPEMVSENSDLVRRHPDWRFSIEGRPLPQCRGQFVLDMTRTDVREYLFEKISFILAENGIDYVKWDCNRNLSNVYSPSLPADRQGEVYHRYMLGVYDLLDKLTKRFPEILFETCSGGGGRFDAGMLYYSPQIWCSDNTDPIDRLEIQFGASLCYPASAMGAHVSSNSRAGYRVKGDVALWGTFGYELDLLKLSREDKEIIREQIAEYRKYYGLTHEGLLYRLVYPNENKGYCSWSFVSRDRAEALATVVFTQPCELRKIFLKLKGLLPESFYREESSGETFSGAYLMNAGFNLLEYDKKLNTSCKLHFVKIG